MYSASFPSLPFIWLLTDGIKCNMFCPQSIFCKNPLLPMAFMAALFLCLEARLKRSILFLSQLSVEDHVVIQVVMLTLCDPMDCRLPCISLYPRVCLNSCPLSQWCHATISFSVAHFFCFWSFPLSESFPMCWLFISGDQGMGALVSVLPMTFQGWFPLGINGWISLLSKRLSRVFSSTTVQKHQLSGPQPLYGATLTSILYYWKNRSFD